MATVQEVKDVFTAKMAGLSGQIATLETQVEAMFALIATMGNAPVELDALKADIEAGFDNLAANVVKVGEDDPNVP